jgi:hypothetical protein
MITVVVVVVVVVVVLTTDKWNIEDTKQLSVCMPFVRIPIFLDAKFNQMYFSVDLTHYHSK